MNREHTSTDDKAQPTGWSDRLDAQYADLMEMVWACERAARREDRIDAVLRYGQSR